MRRVTTEIILRANRLGQRKGRTIFISKTSRGQGVDVASLDPRTPGGRQRLAAFLTPIRRHYTIRGLGAPEEANAINWRAVNLPWWRRTLLQCQVALSFLLKGTPAKNRLYRWMGAHIGRNVEIMQMVWLDHFRPELIWIGDGTLIGAFSQLTVHAYEGQGRFRYGLIEIGRHCLLAGGTGVGPLVMEDGVRTLPGATLSPYLVRIKAGSVVGYAPPAVRLPAPGEPPADE
jgi:acetyltransferase-like isoleucine patch superfamily enzyme